MGLRSSKPQQAAAAPNNTNSNKTPVSSQPATPKSPLPSNDMDVKHDFTYLGMQTDAADTVQSPPSHCEKVRAAYLLSAIGDAVGFNNGQWEHCSDYNKLLGDVARRGGILVTNIKPFRVSDETIMTLATTRALNTPFSSLDELLYNFARDLHSATGDCGGRSLDQVTNGSFRIICPVKGVYQPRAQDFHVQHTTCGAATRSWPIGIFFAREEQFSSLLETSIETARITHHHPTGFVAAFASALFMSCALRCVHVYSWGRLLLDCMPHVRAYIQQSQRAVDQNLKALTLFETTLKTYLEHRNILDPTLPPRFPEPNGAQQCNEAYLKLSDMGLVGVGPTPLAGSEGHHCVIIAYDSILTAVSAGLGGTKRGWVAILERSALHCGDSDGTAALACALWGAMWGTRGVPPLHLDNIEFRNELLAAADQLQTTLQWNLDPPLMLWPLRRGAQLVLEATAYAQNAISQIQSGRSPAAQFSKQISAYNEELTKLSIQMDGMESLTEAERVERRRLLKEFDSLESLLKQVPK